MSLLATTIFIVFNKVLSVFIDRVVCEMHEYVWKVACLAALVGISGETSQAVFEEVNSKRIDAGDKHVKAKVEFEPRDKVGIVDVSLGYFRRPWKCKAI